MVSVLALSVALLPTLQPQSYAVQQSGGPQQASIVERQLVGTWVYDTKTVRINLNATSQKQVANAGAQGKAQLEEMKQGLANIVGRMTLTFQANHVFVAELTGVKDKNLGKWSLRDRDIVVVMEKKDQKVPKMTLAKDGKRITTIYEEPTLGQGLIDMIRKG